MMSNILEYKGYRTKVEFDSEDLVLRGKIEGIADLVNFECEDIKEVEKEFHEAVDDYLQFCKEVGKAPEKEYKGTFNVRIRPELHRRLAKMAMENGETLNAAVEKAIQEYVLEGSSNTVLKTESKYENDNIWSNKEFKVIPLPSRVNMTYREEREN